MPNKTLKVLFFYNGLFVLAGSMLGPLYALFAEKFMADALLISLTWALFLGSATIFTLIISKTGDNFRHKRFLLSAGYLIRSLSWFLMSFVSNIPQLMALQILLGLGEALGTPAFDAILAEHLDVGRHIMDYSDWVIVSRAVLAIGTVLGGIVLTKFGFSVLFYFMSLIAFFCFLGVVSNPALESEPVE